MSECCCHKVNNLNVLCDDLTRSVAAGVREIARLTSIIAVKDQTINLLRSNCQHHATRAQEAEGRAGKLCDEADRMRLALRGIAQASQDFLP